MSIDRSNTLWIANPSFNLLLRIGADANVSTWALSPALNGVKGICVDSMNNLYLSGGNKIYQVKANSHTVEVFAGSGNPGAVDGNWVFTSFNDPSGLGVDAADNIYVWDASNSFLRRINQNKDVETIAGKSGNQSDGTGANIVFGLISSMHFDTFGNLIFSSANAVRKMSPTTNVTTFAGSFNQTGYTNGAGPVARFNNARGVALVQGAIYVCDKVNHRIRKIMFDPAEVPVMGANLELNTHPVVKITGIVGRSYRIESSTNMSTWTPETTILLTRTPYLWFDQAPANTKKFYRAFLLP